MPALAERLAKAPVQPAIGSLQPGMKLDITIPTSSERAQNQHKHKEHMGMPQEHRRSKEIVASNVSKHEIRHAIIAERLGYRLAVTSVKPDGPSLGRVVLADGIRNATDMQLFAAASSASGRDETYSPHGTGHDHAQIEDAGGLHSVNSAVVAVQSMLSEYDPELLNRMAKILDQRGEVIGSIRGIMAEAYMDMMVDRGLHERQAGLFAKLKAEHEKIVAEPVVQSKERFVIEHLTQDRIRISTYADNVMTAEETKCKRCGSTTGGHFEVCRHYEKPKNKFLTDTELPDHNKIDKPSIPQAEDSEDLESLLNPKSVDNDLSQEFVLAA